MLVASPQHEQHDDRGRPVGPKIGQRPGEVEIGKGYTHLVFDTTRLHLVVDDLGTALLCFCLVDILHQHTLVLEDITLRFLVQRVVPAEMGNELVIRSPNQRVTRHKFERKTHKCLSIFPASLYLRRSLRRTRWRRIQTTLVGMRASAVPFLLPGPVCRPLRLAARRSRVRAREWMVVGLTMIRPSLISLRTLVRELAFPISFCSDGSSPTDAQRVPSKSSARVWCN